MRPTSSSMSLQIGIDGVSHGRSAERVNAIVSLTLELRGRKAGGCSPHAKVWKDSLSGPASVSLGRSNRTPPFDPLLLVRSGRNA